MTSRAAIAGALLASVLLRTGQGAVAVAGGEAGATAGSVSSPSGAAPVLPAGTPDAAYTYGIGSFTPDYAAPAPGSYELPPIHTVHDHGLVDSAERATTLERVTGGRIAIVSFFYGTCSESAGCPLATAVLHRLDRRLAESPDLARRVALVSISFDPARDTPARLAQMEKMRAPGSTWSFVTARDEGELQPLLDDFGQTISRLRRADGTFSGQFRHVLKVYLVDGQRRIRNIYSSGYLHPDLVWNDVETIRMEDSGTH